MFMFLIFEDCVFFVSCVLLYLGQIVNVVICLMKVWMCGCSVLRFLDSIDLVIFGIRFLQVMLMLEIFILVILLQRKRCCCFFVNFVIGLLVGQNFDCENFFIIQLFVVYLGIMIVLLLSDFDLLMICVRFRLEIVFLFLQCGYMLLRQIVFLMIFFFLFGLVIILFVFCVGMLNENVVGLLMYGCLSLLKRMCSIVLVFVIVFIVDCGLVFRCF